MSTAVSTPPHTSTSATSLGAKLVNVFVCPRLVFDEVAGAPPRLWNWLVPTLLVCLTSLILLAATTGKEQVADRVRGMVQERQLSSVEAESMSQGWRITSALGTAAGALAGTVWAAFVLWVMGRYFLKTRFAFGKALEVAGVSNVIVALGAVFTLALIGATGDAAARPALSLLAGPLPADSPVRALLEILNVFHLWAIALLAVGLSRLSRVSLKESAFWVFGYWVVTRMALILLA